MTQTLETKPRILLVDDSVSNVRILAAALEEDYVISAATTGAEALRLAAATPPPDLILLDVLMPELDGFEVCRRLKEQSATASIPVIFVTALDDAFNEEHGLQVGAVDYIYKPISPLVVRARVKLHLELKLHREFLERLLELRTGDLEAAQNEARALFKSLFPG
jgi:putative two-component system response regulator